MSILPFGSKKKTDGSEFEEIPVQINDGILDKIRGKETKEENKE